MALFQAATNQMAFGKIGIFGFPGAGKTFTATRIALGINEMTKDKRPLGFFDTETGSDFMIPAVKEAGQELVVIKSRAFSTLVDAIKEAEENCSVLIIDSITHVWRELCDSYQKKLNRTRLQFQDWGAIKSEWADYTDLFVNSNLHIIVCGRAGYEYDYDVNEDGSKDLVKTATKMKTESEFGFEPSLIVEMERVTPTQDELERLNETEQNVNRRKKLKGNLKAKAGSIWIHRAHVLKDRTDTINGKSFDYPTFDVFKPHFAALNIGGEHLGVNTSENSQDRFDAPHGSHRRERDAKRKAALETIQSALLLVWPSTKAEEKQNKARIIAHAFGGTLAWSEVENYELRDLLIKAEAFGKWAKKLDGTSPDIETAKAAWDEIPKGALEEMGDMPL